MDDYLWKKCQIFFGWLKQKIISNLILIIELQYRKLYSKFMEDSENIIKMPKTLETKVQNSKLHFPHTKQPKQLHQNAYNFSAYQTSNKAQKCIQQFSKSLNSQQQSQQTFLSTKLLLFGISSLEFSILLSLLIVELISSIFSIYQFALAGFFILFVHAALWVVVWMGTRDHSAFHNGESEEMITKNLGASNENKQTNTSTQQKISPFYHERKEVKTKKIQAVQLQAKIDYVLQSTMKKVQITPKTYPCDNKNQKKRTSKVSRYCLVIKISQTVVTASLIIICMIISNENSTYDQTILILSLLSSFTQIVSSISFGVWIAKVWSQKKSRIINQNHLNQLSKQNEYQIQCPQNRTVTSIDNAFQYKKDETAVKKEGQEEKKMELKVEDNIKLAQTSETPKSIGVQTPKSIGQDWKSQKSQLKKSVLKSSKGKMGKSTKTPIFEQDAIDCIVSKRKVEINEKKIQYFEYSQSGSITNSNQQNPPKTKSKYSDQKIKILQKKLEIEAQILKKKMEIRRVTSAAARNQTKSPANKKDVTFNENECFS